MEVHKLAWAKAHAAKLILGKAMTMTPGGLDALRQHEVVIDLASQYVVLGTLVGADGPYLVIEDADVHDLRDSTTNREQYVVEARRHGIQANRKCTRLRQEEVVCIAKLEDVIA